MIVGRELTKLQKEFPELEITKVDIMAQPLKSLKQGITMIPTLTTGQETLSGFMLSSSRIRDFVLHALEQSKSS
ncbi:MAG: hypothetical protein DSY70_08965 [Desulfobulbus sp.]|nr:MAG: hypothetical protein DSY70_08965 [Desulfobulbus sp.]